MTKLHRVKSFMRRSPNSRSSAFENTTAALRDYVRKHKRIRVKAISRRVTG